MAKRRRKVIRSWLESLGVAERESVFAWMRSVGEKALRGALTARRLGAPAGSISVGAGAFDPFLRAEGAQQYLSALRGGQGPDSALEHALKWGRGAVVAHNAQRPRDMHWQRSACSGSSNLEHIHRSLLRVIQKQGQTGSGV